MNPEIFSLCFKIRAFCKRNSTKCNKADLNRIFACYQYLLPVVTYF